MDGRSYTTLAKLTRVKALNPANPNKSTAIFGGEASGILNWNDLAYPHFYTLRQRIRSLFWTANEVDMSVTRFSISI